jgi:hypothetical protein
MPCFDLSGFTPLNEGTKYKYRTAWGVFETVQNNDVAVSTMRARGDYSKRYWKFKSGEERDKWILGLSLHVKRYPTSNWSPPDKN